jgi:ATP-dependent DNA helicase RecQ
VTPREALRHYFDFSEFRPGQEAALNHLLAGRDTLVVMPTGSGKSIIYQLAALLSSGTALVISPLVALMKDQIDGLARRNIPAAFINSSLSGAEGFRRLRALAEGKYKIVLVAPERLRSRPFREALAKVRLSLLAVDEAHCLSQWGHDFRPDYLHIAQARRDLGEPVTLALTATATPRVQDDIIRKLGLSRAEKIVTGFNRPNLTFEVFAAPSLTAKHNFLRDFLKGAEGAGIIYVGTRREAEEVAAFASDGLGLEVQHYHAGLDSDLRTQIQESFLAGDLPLIVATNAFGMGIDRPDVRFVLHWAMPGTLEAYYQEAGRAGRDGLPARAVLLYSPKDIILHEFFIENDSPSAIELRAVHNFLRSLPPVPDDDGSGMGGGLTRWDGETVPRPLVAASYDAVMQSTGLPHVKIRVALEQLQAANAIRRAPDESFSQMRIEVLSLPEAVLNQIAKGVAERREHKRHQLGLMTNYAETDACRRRTLLKHFGDSAADGGGDAAAPICCDNCLAHPEAEAGAAAPARPAQTQAERGALIVLDTIAWLKWEVGKGKLAQILKGALKPEEARPEYTGHRNYGKFIGLKLKEIESLINQLLESGHVKQVGGDRPTLKLTSRGEAALKARTAINVELRPVQAIEAERQKAKAAAGGTVALSGQMLSRGFTPEQIAAQRGLTVGTIYSHLATLIAVGELDVDQVVPAALQKQIRGAIEQAGSADRLAPIKALLPEEIGYDLIRCVANAWLREKEATNRPSQQNPAKPQPGLLNDLPFEALRRWRHERALEWAQPDFVVFGDDTLRRLILDRPRTKDELRAYRSLTEEVIEKHGDELLALLQTPTASTSVTDAILECVYAMPGRLPRSGVAKLLVGSASERVADFQSDPLYNRLAGYNRNDVMAQVDAMLEAGMLAQDEKGHLVLPGV